MGKMKLVIVLVIVHLFIIIGGGRAGVAVMKSSSPKICQFPAIFNFGDSNSDTGGLSAAFGQAPPPNGETFFHRPVGRYSDGRLIIDFIAKRLGLPYLNAYLDSMGTNFTHGANFATADSTILRQNSTLFQGGFSPFSMDVQLWQYSQFQSRSQTIYNKGGVFRDLMPSKEFFGRALYTFDIGQNDLTSAYFLNMTTPQVKAYIPDVLNQFSTLLKDLYYNGARFFWVHNTGPFGCLAYVLERLPIRSCDLDKVGCAEPYNKVAQYFNHKLKRAIARLRKQIPDASITYVDVYTVKYTLISQARKHGFEHPLRACCGHGGKYNFNKDHGCGSYVNINGTNVLIGKSCVDPATSIIWDGVHYTEAANHWVFNHIANGFYSDPPHAVDMACYINGD